jgi:sulfur relay protein TusB/DsrH
MKTLHIIRNLNDRLSQATIRSFSECGEEAVLLMQDAVYDEIRLESVKVYVCQEDLFARQIKKEFQQVSYDDIARLVTEFDRTIVW